MGDVRLPTVIADIVLQYTEDWDIILRNSSEAYRFFAVNGFEKSSVEAINNIQGQLGQ